jgi:hypothetical protein
MSAALTASETLTQGRRSNRMNLPQTLSRRTKLAIVVVRQELVGKVWP